MRFSPTADFPELPKVRLSAISHRRRPQGGPIALVEEGDLIEVNIPKRILRIVGIAGEKKSPEEIDEILKERKSRWTPKPAKYQKGVLKIFSERAVSPMKGGYME